MRLTTFGFTLLELMIVLVIIGILTSLALPSYQKYVERARFAEIIFATQPYKTAITIALQQGFPRSGLENGKYGIPDALKPTKNLASLTVTKGNILAKGTALVEEASYLLTPDALGTTWTVNGTCIKLGLCHE